MINGKGVKWDKVETVLYGIKVKIHFVTTFHFFKSFSKEYKAYRRRPDLGAPVSRSPIM